MSHICMGHVAHFHESCRTFQLSHVANFNESCRTRTKVVGNLFDVVLLHIMRRLQQFNLSPGEGEGEGRGVGINQKVISTCRDDRDQ